MKLRHYSPFRFALGLMILLTGIHFSSLGQSLGDKNYIRVDQFGYLPNAKKIAVIADPQTGFNASEGITPYNPTSQKVQLRKKSDNTIVYEALPANWNGGATDSFAGDKGYWFDFSSYTTAGEYYVRVYKTASTFVDSHSFRINADVYREVLRVAINMFYYQRANQNKTSAYASGANWVDDKWFPKDATAKYWYDNSKTKDDLGGWIDAGDPNKYINFLAGTISDLLTAYQQNKTLFDGLDLKIPESGNSTPDLLDEIKWEIDWVKKMQVKNSDGSYGGIYLKSGTSNSDYISPPSTDTRERYYEQLCPSSSIVGAGIMAHAALVFGDIYGASYKSDLLARAEAAWNYYSASPDKGKDCDDSSRGNNQRIQAGDGDADANTEHLAEAVSSAIYLYALTGKDVYQNFIVANYLEARPLKNSGSDEWAIYRSNQGSSLIYYATSLPSGRTAISTVKAKILEVKTSNIKSTGTPYSVIDTDNLYRAKPIYTLWGSNQLVSGQAADNMDFVEYGLKTADNTKYTERALSFVNYVHGVNPLGMCYLSNMYQYGGDFCFDEMWHSWFKPGTKYDNIDNGNIGPAPGFLAGGVNTSYTNADSKVKIGTQNYTNAFTKDQPVQKRFTNENGVNAPWIYNEPAIYYQAAYIRMLAHFVSEASSPTPTPVDDVISTTAPGSVTQGSNATVTVNYSASTNRDLYVLFQLDTSPYTNYQSVKVDVTAGSNKTATVTVPIPANTPIATDAYQFQTYLTTDGGTWTTKLDNLNKPDIDVVAASTTTRYQAENATLTGMSVATSTSGYAGTGYATGMDATGDKVTFTVNVPSAGTYSLTIRYSVCNAQQNYVLINGTSTNKSFSDGIANCGGWENLTYNVSLNSGNNTIAIQKNWGYTEIDYIEIGPAASARQGLDLDEQAPSAALLVYPNPARSSINVLLAAELTGEWQVQLTDLLGRKVLQQRYQAINNQPVTIATSHLPKGLYVLKAVNGTQQLSQKVLIEK